MKEKEKEMKNKFCKEYLRWLRLILRSKLNGRNKIMAVNTWAGYVMRYGTDELKSLDRRIRKFMAVHGELHPKSDVNIVYLSREMEGRRLISCQGCIRMKKTTWNGMSGTQLSN